MVEAATPVVDVRDVSLVYAGDRVSAGLRALDHVSLSVTQGSFVSLIGPSGCGKSTLLRLVADLLTPTAGDISVGGVTPKAARLARQIGFVFQAGLFG